MYTVAEAVPPVYGLVNSTRCASDVTKGLFQQALKGRVRRVVGPQRKHRSWVEVALQRGQPFSCVKARVAVAQQVSR